MNEKIMKTCGFNKEIDLVKENKCPFCKKPINEKDFRDELSLKINKKGENNGI